MNEGRVVEILVAAAPGAEMKSVPAARAVAGRGLEGDRYFLGVGTFSPTPQKPEFELTLIERECVEEFAKETGLEFTAAGARRNVVTEGVRLNDFVGVTFRVGEVVARGIELCEPCAHLARLSFAETLEGLAHKGGLRAQIVEGGMVRVGDSVR